MHNFRVIYITNNGYKWYYDYIIRVLIFIKNYYYNLFVNIIYIFYLQIPVNKSMNCKNYHL